MHSFCGWPAWPSCAPWAVLVLPVFVSRTQAGVCWWECTLCLVHCPFATMSALLAADTVPTGGSPLVVWGKPRGGFPKGGHKANGVRRMWRAFLRICWPARCQPRTLPPLHREVWEYPRCFWLTCSAFRQGLPADGRPWGALVQHLCTEGSLWLTGHQRVVAALFKQSCRADLAGFCGRHR